MSKNNHFRSISLPTTFHPISTQFDEQLSRLISSKNTTTSCSSLTQSLITLIGLYDCVDELLLRPANQQIISKNSQEKWVDDILEGSWKLLDVCDVARDALFSMKECLQGVESTLRRSNGDISEYVKSRQKVKKGITRFLKNIRKNRRIDRRSDSLDSVFLNVDVITTDVFTGLLGHIAGTKSESSKSNMSLIVRLVRQFSDIDKAGCCTEFRDIDVQLRYLICQKKSSINRFNRTRVEKIRCKIIKLESEIEELCEELECLFRHLVKTRATLLNLLSN
ncbi:uncharacterized protein LOC141613058 [Silene latifolia]|uniref:uncharacterized protein LOC141613058 n=1 Tax=Silene latifolia TaxID=37657 RepID=UPI003D7728BC